MEASHLPISSTKMETAQKHYIREYHI